MKILLAGLLLLVMLGSDALAQQAPFDIDFHAIDTASALRVLARQAGLNLVVTEGVKGSVSLQLRQADGLSAMRAIDTPAALPG